MTGSAIRREVLFPLFQIARLQIRNIDAATSALLVLRLCFLVVNKRDHRGEVHFRKVETWRSFIETAVAHDVADLIALHVFRYKLGSGQIRAAFTAACVFAVAKPAVLAEKGLSVFHQLRRISLGIYARGSFRGLFRNSRRLDGWVWRLGQCSCV